MKDKRTEQGQKTEIHVAKIEINNVTTETLNSNENDQIDQLVILVTTMSVATNAVVEMSKPAVESMTVLKDPISTAILLNEQTMLAETSERK
jgi:hypothetical protein